MEPKTFIALHQPIYILQQTTGPAEEPLLRQSWNKSSVQAFFQMRHIFRMRLDAENEFVEVI